MISDAAGNNDRHSGLAVLDLVRIPGLYGVGVDVQVTECPAGPHTHSITEVCELIGCDSIDWLVDRVRNGTFPGRKIVRQLRFSDDDIRNIIDACATAISTLPQVTSRSRGRQRIA